MNLVLTKNFYTWMRTILIGGTKPSSSGNSGHIGGSVVPIGTLTTINGENPIYLTGLPDKAQTNYTLLAHTSNNTITNYTSFLIGSDSEKATENDYKLKSPIEQTNYSMAISAPNYPVLQENGKALLAFTLMIQVPQDQPTISIGEIGLFKSLYTNINGKANNHTFLFGRVALDTPIELKAGENATFQVSIEI